MDHGGEEDTLVPKAGIEQVSLRPENLQGIRSRASGWEREWWELEALLRDAIEALRPRLRSYFHWSDADWEDFNNWILDDYKRRAERGTLLMGFHDERQADDPLAVVAFLADPGFLRRRMISYRRRIAGQRHRAEIFSLDERDPSGRSRIPAQPDPRAARGSRQFDDLIESISRELERLTLSVPETGAFDRIVEQAAIQLFPRIDWGRGQMERLGRHLEATIADPRPDFPGPLSFLRHLHADDGAQLERQISELNEQLFEASRRLGSDTIRRLEQRADKLRFEQTFRPLSAPSLMRLLGITRADADQRRSRYLSRLPTLLPALVAIVEGGEIL